MTPVDLASEHHFYRRVGEPEVRALAKRRGETEHTTAAAIFHFTASRGSHAEHYTSFLEFADRRPLVMISAINDSRVCPYCLSMDAVIIAASDRAMLMAYGPPYGLGCRCGAISLSRAQAAARMVFSLDPIKDRPPPKLMCEDWIFDKRWRG